MKKLLIASAAIALTAGMASAEDIKIGISMGFTGPLESMSPAMASGAELAIKEVSDSGKLLDGSTVTAIRADNTCADAAAAVTAVERLVTADKVNGIVGGMCSGETIATLEKVGVPNGVVMISPSATSPALTTIDDKGFFFRTSPSDARQGEVMADIATEHGVKNVAITYTNNDYGKGLADAFTQEFTSRGGTISITVPHEDGKADYSAIDWDRLDAGEVLHWPCGSDTPDGTPRLFLDGFATADGRDATVERAAAGHLDLFGLLGLFMIVAQKVQHAMNDQMTEMIRQRFSVAQRLPLQRLARQHQVSRHGSGRVAGRQLHDGKRKDVRRLVLAAPLAVQSAQHRIVGKRDADLGDEAWHHAGPGQGRAHGLDRELRRIRQDAVPIRVFDRQDQIDRRIAGRVQRLIVHAGDAAPAWTASRWRVASPS
mgnify:CR=1 FL=1